MAQQQILGSALAATRRGMQVLDPPHEGVRSSVSTATSVTVSWMIPATIGGAPKEMVITAEQAGQVKAVPVWIAPELSMSML
jgi:hypothetical protein